MEIGIDIEECERFKDKSEHFISRFFTKKEIEYASSKTKSQEEFCAFWCVKEAVVKAFSNKNISFLDIEVLHDENGKPFVNKNKTILFELNKNNLSEIKISISHTVSTAVAICLLY